MQLNIANLLTFSRVIIVFPVALLILNPSPLNIIISLILTIFSYVTDILDGMVARKFHQESKFGATLDIACDRVQEFAYWLIFIYTGALPLMVGVIAFAREIVTDTIRQKISSERGGTLITVITNPISQLIVTSRFSRAINGFVKIVTFSIAHIYLLSFYYWPNSTSTLLSLCFSFAWITAGVIVLRGALIIYDSYPYLKNEI